MTEKMKAACFLCIFIIFIFTDVVSCLDKDYLNQLCDTSKYIGTARRLESSTALYYEPNTACYYSVTVDAGKQVMVIVKTFDLESEVMNACVDFVNFHDGPNTGLTTLNPTPICHEDAAANYTSTGNQLTVYFETDATGARHGFNFVIVAITAAPCNSGQFACNNSICIDESLRCDQYDECGDNSDEIGCDYTAITGTKPNDDAPLIIGLSIGIPLIIICGLLVAYWCWRYNRWRLFVKRPLTTPEVEHDSTTFEECYPVTNIYYKEKFQSLYRKPGPWTPGYVTRDVILAEQGSTSTRKPDGDVSASGSEQGSA